MNDTNRKQTQPQSLALLREERVQRRLKPAEQAAGGFDLSDGRRKAHALGAAVREASQLQSYSRTEQSNAVRHARILSSARSRNVEVRTCYKLFMVFELRLIFCAP